MNASTKIQTLNCVVIFTFNHVLTISPRFAIKRSSKEFKIFNPSTSLCLYINQKRIIALHNETTPHINGTPPADFEAISKDISSHLCLFLLEQMQEKRDCAMHGIIPSITQPQTLKKVKLNSKRLCTKTHTLYYKLCNTIKNQIVNLSQIFGKKSITILRPKEYPNTQIWERLLKPQ